MSTGITDIFPAGTSTPFTQLPTFNTQSPRWQHTPFGPPWTLAGSISEMYPNGSNDGPAEWAAREWVSGYTGQVEVVGHLAKYDTNANSSGIYGRIYWNHQMIYQQFIAGTDGVGVSYSVALTLNVGDVLDFTVAPNGIDSNDLTLFSATVSSAYDTATVDFGTPISVKSVLGMLAGFDDKN